MSNADSSSNQQQILQAVLDVEKQALRVNDVSTPTDPDYVSTMGKAVVGIGTVDYVPTPVTSGTWVTVIAATTALSSELEIFDSSGQLMYIGVGPAASEAIQIYDFPGGNGRTPLAIPSGSRIAVKAVSTTANAGFIALNVYGV